MVSWQFSLLYEAKPLIRVMDGGGIFHVFACICVFQTSGTVVTEQLGIFRCAFLSRHNLFLSKSSIITFSFLITFSLSDQLAVMFQCFIYLSHGLFFLTISFNGFSLEYLS